MSKEREAMHLAYEALCYASYEDTDYDDVCDQKVLEARRALRQVLKTEQEPVAQPKQWVGLTDKDIDDCYFAARQPDFDVWSFAQEIEEVLKLKNT